MALLVIAFALAAGCARGPSAATLEASDGAKFGDAVIVRADLTNELPSDLRVHYSQFSLRAGSGFFKCANQGSGWRLVDVDAERRVVDVLTLAPRETVTTYVKFGLCSDVAGPYTLRWRLESDDVKVRPLDRDENVTADLDAFVLFARDWREHERLVS